MWLAQAEPTIGTPADLIVVVVYLLGIMAFGTWFGRHTRSSRDFFVSGQRFSAWLITASYIATLVGSYSFMKYSEAGYKYGLSSTSTYMNDWFIMPLFMFGWLPIIYFNRVLSIPEFFERRFDRATRVAGTVIILLYMILYIGNNLYTIAVALQPVLGLEVMTIVAITALFCGVYVTAGGQTSVIMTDLAQGVLLLVVGLGVFALGVVEIGGWSEFWGRLPADHKAGMARFNEPSDFNAVGLFWQDGMANSFAFYFINQGIILRFLAAKSPAEGRRAALQITLIMMPLTAIAVSGAGWVGAVLLPPESDPKQVFVAVSDFLCSEIVFGFVLAALTAALMSTIDTLINAVSAIGVNDVYRPYIKPGADDRHYLLVARILCIAVAAIGVCLVPFFMRFDSLYRAHAAFTAAITPPLVVVIFLGITWRRFSGKAAVTTIAVGMVAIFVSVGFPEIVAPFAHGVGEEGKGLVFMRAFFGIVVCGAVALVSGLLFRPARLQETRGLTIWGLDAARRAFKGGGTPREADGRKIDLELVEAADAGEDALLNEDDLKRLSAGAGDLLYVADRRWWLGGLRSLHVRARVAPDVPPGTLRLAPANVETGRLRRGERVRVEVIL